MERMKDEQVEFSVFVEMKSTKLNVSNRIGAQPTLDTVLERPNGTSLNGKPLAEKWRFGATRKEGEQEEGEEGEKLENKLRHKMKMKKKKT